MHIKLKYRFNNSTIYIVTINKLSCHNFQFCTSLCGRKSAAMRSMRIYFPRQLTMKMYIDSISLELSQNLFTERIFRRFSPEFFKSGQTGREIACNEQCTGNFCRCESKPCEEVICLVSSGQAGYVRAIQSPRSARADRQITSHSMKATPFIFINII